VAYACQRIWRRGSAGQWELAWRTAARDSRIHALRRVIFWEELGERKPNGIPEKKLHREVPPLHVPGALFSVTCDWLRSIDRSAPRACSGGRLGTRKSWRLRGQDYSLGWRPCLQCRIFGKPISQIDRIALAWEISTGRKYRFSTGDQDLAYCRPRRAERPEKSQHTADCSKTLILRAGETASRQAGMQTAHEWNRAYARLFVAGLNESA